MSRKDLAFEMSNPRADWLAKRKAHYSLEKGHLREVFLVTN